MVKVLTGLRRAEKSVRAFVKDNQDYYIFLNEIQFVENAVQQACAYSFLYNRLCVNTRRPGCECVTWGKKHIFGSYSVTIFTLSAVQHRAALLDR